MTEKTQPTDAEIEALGHRMCWRYKHDTGVNHISTFTFNAQTLLDFSRAVLARWGQPAHSGEPVAWRYRMSGDMQWQYTERKEQFSHASEVEALTNMQPVEREPLTPREIELIDGMIAVQLDHAMRCDAIANRAMADKQKGWDMERVALLQKFKAAHGSQGGQHGTDT